MTSDDEALETLLRWEAAGGYWLVLSRTRSRLTVALLRCDGGEEVHRIVSSDPALANHIGSRDSNEP